jgi:ribonuclease HI
MKNVIMYADGGCRGNGMANNVGGYGVVLRYGEHTKELKGATKNTTNNIMELTSCITGLSILKEPCEVTLYSDSQYVVDAFNNGWIAGWIKNGWRTASKTPVKNKELWEELIALTKKHSVKFVKVAGHSTNEGNNRADALANEAMDELR